MGPNAFGYIRETWIYCGHRMKGKLLCYEWLSRRRLQFPGKLPSIYEFTLRLSKTWQTCSIPLSHLLAIL